MRTGDTAIFWVELAVPEGPVQWLRNQEEMVAGDRVAITAEGTCHTLTIFQCTLEDMGEVAFMAGGCRTTTQFCVSGKVFGWPSPQAHSCTPVLPPCCRASLTSGSPRVAENCGRVSSTPSSSRVGDFPLQLGGSRPGKRLLSPLMVVGTIPSTRAMPRGRLKVHQSFAFW